MANQTLQSSDQTQIGLPREWEEKFIIKRFDEDPIEISLQEQQAILENLAKGQKFIQIGKHTIMLNSMKGIDPKYEPDNIPPCPKKETTGMVVKGVWKEEVLNQKEIDLWHELFGNKTSPVKLYKQIK